MTNVVYQITCNKQYFDTVNFYIGPFTIYSIDIFNEYSCNRDKYRFYKAQKTETLSPYWYLGHKRTNQKLCQISLDKQKIKVGSIKMDIKDMVSVDFLQCYFVALKDVFKNSKKSLYHVDKCEKKTLKVFFKKFNLCFDL